MNMKKIILTVLSVIFILCLAISPFSAVAEVESETASDDVTTVSTTQTTANADDFYIEIDKKGTKFERIGKTDKAELYMMKVDGCGYIFAIKNTKTGAVWYSIKNDVIRNLGNAPMMYRSLFEIVNISYLGGNTRATQQFTASSISYQENDNYKVEKIDNGVKFTFEFTDGTENMGFTIPVTVTVVDDHVDVSVPFDEIKTHDTCASNLITVSPMKYFASAGYGADNYTLIPDGSGALVYNDYVNGDGTTTTEYSTYVYDRDAALDVRESLGNTNSTVLPVFGAKHEDSAVLAVISQGDGVSKFRSKSAIKNNYSYAFNEFTYKTYDQIIAGKIWDQEKIYTRVSNNYTNIENATVSYYPLGGDDANYMGMAKKYREIIKDGRSSNEELDENVELYIENVGAVTKEESSFGFIIDKTFAVTTFEQSAEMVQTLSKEGVNNINVRFSGWQKDGLGGGAITDAKIEKLVGDKESLAALNKVVNSVGGKVFMDFDFVNIDSGKFGWSIGKLATRNAIKEYCEFYDYRLNTGEKIKDDDAYIYYKVKPKYIQAQVDEMYDEFESYSLGAISVGTLGSSHYSDLVSSEDYCDAQISINKISQVLAGLTENNTVMVDNGYANTFSSADVIVGMPMYDSGANIGAVDIPFAQIVLHGVIAYTETAHNLTSLTQVQLLRELETGTLPYYIITGENPSIFAGTRYDYIVSSRFDVWKDNIVSDYKTLSSVLDGYCDKEITDYKYLTKDNNVRATTYNDELTVVVNYSTKDVKLSNGKTVKAESYITLSAGEV